MSDATTATRLWSLPWGKLARAWAICQKDMKIYYLQPDILVFGLLFPVAIFFAFIIGREVRPVNLFPGLISLTLFFSTTTVAPFSVPWEKMNRTFERLQFTPVGIVDIVLGKAISASLFGIILSGVSLLIGLLFFGTHVGDVPALLLAFLLGSFCMAMVGVLISTVNAKTPPLVMMVLNAIRLPLMFISGIFIAIPEMPPFARILSCLSPVSYCSD
jgi:ABC-2 type transport system permease protein